MYYFTCISFAIRPSGRKSAIKLIDWLIDWLISLNFQGDGWRAHLDMHHLIFGINFQIHFVTSPVLSRFTFSSTCQHISHHFRSRHPSLLIHSFTPGSKPTFSTNPFHLRLLFLLDWLHDNWTEPDLSRSSVYFQFLILIICLFGVVDYATRQLFTAR